MTHENNSKINNTIILFPHSEVIELYGFMLAERAERNVYTRVMGARITRLALATSVAGTRGLRQNWKILLAVTSNFIELHRSFFFFPVEVEVTLSVISFINFHAPAKLVISK